MHNQAVRPRATRSRNHRRHELLALNVLALFWLAAVGCGSESRPSEDAVGVTPPGPITTNNATDTWQPLAPDADFADHSLRDWADAWVRWSNAPTDCDLNPAFDVDGSMCNEFQPDDSPVFFLQAGDVNTVRTRCVVPSGKAIFVPLAGFYVDNAGREPALDDAALEEEANIWLDSVRDLTLAVDGAAVGGGLEPWTVAVVRSDYELPPEPNVYTCVGLPGVTGRIAPAYIGGAFVVLPPPERGMHTIEYGGTLTTAQGDDILSYVKATFMVQ